jgi:hypothetical protein
MSNDTPSTTTIGTTAKLRRKIILIGFVVSKSLLITVILAAGLTLSSPSISTPSPLSTVSAQLPDQVQSTSSGLSSSSLSISTSSSSLSTSTSEPKPTSTSPDLKFSYSVLGVSSGNYQRILYDSETNSLRLTNISAAVKENESGSLSLSQRHSQSQFQSNRQIADSDKNNLQKIIDDNGFFQTNGTYLRPNTGENENYDTLYVLSIEMDNRHHTVIWTDATENIPTVLQSIVKAIEKISSA